MRKENWGPVFPSTVSGLSKRDKPGVVEDRLDLLVCLIVSPPCCSDLDVPLPVTLLSSAFHLHYQYSDSPVRFVPEGLSTFVPLLLFEWDL